MDVAPLSLTVSLAGWPCYVVIDCTLCYLHYLHWLAFVINGGHWHWFSPSMRLLAPHAPRWLSTLFLMLITNSLFVFVTYLHHSALDHPCAPSHNLHFILYSQRDTSLVGIASWRSSFWPTIMLCSNFRGHMSILSWIIWVIPVQGNPSML